MKSYPKYKSLCQHHKSGSVCNLCILSFLCMVFHMFECRCHIFHLSLFCCTQNHVYILKIKTLFKFVYFSKRLTNYTEATTFVTSLFYIRTIFLFITWLSACLSAFVTGFSISALIIIIAFLGKNEPHFMVKFFCKSYQGHNSLCQCHMSVSQPYNLSFLYSELYMCQSMGHRFHHFCSQCFYSILKNQI